MERQVHMTMARLGVQEDRRRESVDPGEEQFLKSLYLFMKKRDTPIERIPHLGFKQIDLYVMFKTVRSFGGYHQVTAQQLWKQVYNSLGGNPRSTSAATCTRRHYEKLLLPYECHLKGQRMSAILPHPMEHFRYHGYSPEDRVCDGPRPAKRKLMSMPLHHQNPSNLQSGTHRSLFPLPFRPPHYYHPSPSVLPPYVPMPPSVVASRNQPTVPPTKFSFPPCGPKPKERVKEPLEHLRYLAEQYKSSSGLSEPLNLSIKAPCQRTDKIPKSSFAPPLSGKTPKFLNTPSSLYTPQYPQVARKEGSRKPDEAAAAGVVPYPEKAREDVVVDLTGKEESRKPDEATAAGLVPYPEKVREDVMVDLTSKSSPEYDGSPTDCGNMTKEQLASPEGRRLNPSHIPAENNSKMEIEIPLSVFHNWLRLYGPHGAANNAKQLPQQLLQQVPRHLQVEEAERRSKGMLPTNLSFHFTSHRQSSTIEDLRVVNRKVPSPRSSGQAAATPQVRSHKSFPDYSPSSSVQKPAATVDVCPFPSQGMSLPHRSKPPTYWEALAKERPPSPPAVPQDLTVTTSRHGDIKPASPKAVETRLSSSSLLMMNSGSASVLQLTSEEVMKLKKIISSSS
ncbi:AT-rich interaction domain 6 [Nerophis lumbriciformis]|uniref:AT-rich interaction domain 6 n=1 Tax=Nerophis lumbriciformis TaxID=546530 RepID=UPI002AE0565B|nr:AT-rich interaction domain 6 [Nerophis lumbriciformis]